MPRVFRACPGSCHHQDGRTGAALPFALPRAKLRSWKLKGLAEDESPCRDPAAHPQLSQQRHLKPGGSGAGWAAQLLSAACAGEVRASGVTHPRQFLLFYLERGHLLLFRLSSLSMKVATSQCSYHRAVEAVEAAGLLFLWFVCRGCPLCRAAAGSLHWNVSAERLPCIVSVAAFP